MRYILLASLLVPTIAFADTAPDVSKMKTDDCARARKANKTCVLDMGGENLEGEKVTATGSGWSAREFATMSSLIRIRKDFITEILKSAENVD
jgi:hypothetical protein